MSTAPSAPTNSARWTVAAFVPAAVVAAWQAHWPWPFFSDDAFVSLRYAERLLDGNGLTWTAGERVEGYSNLAWVLACAALGALGIDLVTAARLLGAACTAAALWAVARALRPRTGHEAAIAAAATMLVASSGTVMAWTLGGLEGPMVMACLAFGFAALVRANADDADPARWPVATLFRCGLPFALACWTRPDAPLWAAIVGTMLGLAARRAGVRTAVATLVWFAMPSAIAFAAQLAFRVAYYGEWVPNTAYVKAQFDPGSGAQGLEYVASALRTSPGLTWPALAGAAVLILRARTRLVGAMLAAPVAAWLVYLAVIGGDHFPGRRLLHGALAPMALLGALGCRELCGGRKGLVAAGTLLLAAFGAVAVYVSRTDDKFVEPKYETWEWRGKVVGEALHRAFADAQPRLAVDSAGVVPFYSRLPALDMLGLCDRTIARAPFRPWLLDIKARGVLPLPPGHLRGDGEHVMSCKPDLILMGTPPGLPLPVFVSALEFESDPRFLFGYRCVLLDLGEHELASGSREPIVAPLWTALHGKVGLRASAERVEAPAWLFGSLRLRRPVMLHHLAPPPDTDEGRSIAAEVQRIVGWMAAREAVAVPGADALLELELRAPSAEFEAPLPAGTWRARAEPADAAVRILGTTPGASTIVADGVADVTIVVERTSASSLPARVRRVVFERER
ncbi:MAG: hypothetical protein JNK78_04880 [Planctomycetes bacterium]|nr:hypothetical protein [Planctomycetota bacterium]